MIFCWHCNHCRIVFEPTDEVIAIFKKNNKDYDLFCPMITHSFFKAEQNCNNTLYCGTKEYFENNFIIEK